MWWKKGKKMGDEANGIHYSYMKLFPLLKNNQVNTMFLVLFFPTGSYNPFPYVPHCSLALRDSIL